tara:strand:+ start:592 stop:855 length:264 start_codon:yes stop_codon:yes gene_type:complete
MMSLVLTADNSSGRQNLFFDRQDDGEISVTLVGVYEGREIQLDFDNMTERDLDDFISYLQRRKQEKVRPLELSAEEANRLRNGGSEG